MSFDYKKLLKPELNVGLQDRKIRYGVGAAVLLLSVFLASIPLAIIGGMLVASAHFRWCPVYSALNKSTVNPEEEKAAGGSCCSGHHHGGEQPGNQSSESDSSH
jgi:hypothetical protein